MIMVANWLSHNKTELDSFTFLKNWLSICTKIFQPFSELDKNDQDLLILPNATQSVLLYPDNILNF